MHNDAASQEARMEPALVRLAEISCGARRLDTYLAGVCVDVLGPWEARTAAIFALQADLSVSCEAVFGLPPRRQSHWDGDTVLRDSPLSRCLRGDPLLIPSSSSEWIAPEAGAYSLFLPIRQRHAPIGALWLSFAVKPDQHEHDDFWAVVAGTTGLALLAQAPPTARQLPEAGQSLPELTDRQMEILTSVATGATNRQIARAMHLGLSTVGHELMAIFQQLGVGNRRDAVREAGARGLLGPPPAQGAPGGMGTVTP